MSNKAGVSAIGVVAIASCILASCAFGSVALAGDDGDLSNIPSLPPSFGMRPAMPDRTRPDGETGRDRPRLPSGHIPMDFGTVIGPGGMLKPMPPRRAEAPKPKPLTPEQRAAAITKALAPRAPLADVRRRTLDDLYAKLAVASDEAEAKGLASLIGSIWARSGSDTANLLMSRADDAVRQKHLAVALELLDRVVALQPNWPEAWNKRASVRFENGDLDGSMADVSHVLKLEPKHFGALEGMAMILQRTGLDKRALEVWRKALAIYPHQPDVEATVDKLSLQVEGQRI